MQFPERLIDRLRRARRVFVLTGAGISAESGVPTFRDAQSGLWAKFKPEELATPEAFRRNPKLVWDWYAERRRKLVQTQPNPGHLAIAEIERRVDQFTLATQNIDGLHQRAGSRQVIELHGSILRTRCLDHGLVFTSWPETRQSPPPCPHCGGLLRPDVVWFGELLPEAAFEEAAREVEQADVCFSVGTSALVYPAASLPRAAREHGALLVEINPERTSLTSAADHFVRGPAGEVLPALVAAVWNDC
jgi:NAD-dependent deacetylase